MLQTYKYNECWEILHLLACQVCHPDAPVPQSGFPGCSESKFPTSANACYHPPPPRALLLSPLMHWLSAPRWQNTCTGLRAAACRFKFSVVVKLLSNKLFRKHCNKYSLWVHRIQTHIFVSYSDDWSDKGKRPNANRDKNSTREQNLCNSQHAQSNHRERVNRSVLRRVVQAIYLFCAHLVSTKYD